MQKSPIEWTDRTWNVLRGCTPISPGCDHCYAKKIAERFRDSYMRRKDGTKVPHPFYYGFDPRLAPHKIAEPYHSTQNNKVFANSMSDIMHSSFSVPYIQEICTTMSETNWNVYQVLTKRPIRLKNLMDSQLDTSASAENVWWGTSVESKAYAWRIEALRKTRAAIKFLSVEPLLEDLGDINLDGIDWVIVGGESGPGAREMEADWVQNIMTQCREQHTAFFFKQWGGVRKKTTGRQINKIEYDEYPEFEFNPVPNAAIRTELLDAHLQRIAPWLAETQDPIHINGTLDPTQLPPLTTTV